jgi:RNA polymerase sigma-70 factor (ECF subfamily)
MHPITVENLPETPTPIPSPGEAFKTTHWSVVLSSGHDSESVAQQALEQLCRSYWFPLYAYVRRHGHSREDAQDLTQSFFERFLERGYFARAERERGRFRTFLLTSLKRFLTEEWRRANRQKRGGNQTFVPFAPEEAENRYCSEPRDELSPDILYDVRWAGVLLERVVTRLRKDYESTGRTAVYTQLQQFLWGRQTELSYAEISQELGMNTGAVKVAVHRLRQRFRDLLREEVANTVEMPEQIDDELRHLLGAFGA